jgi:hypothetical protein
MYDDKLLVAVPYAIPLVVSYTIKTMTVARRAGFL